MNPPECEPGLDSRHTGGPRASCPPGAAQDARGALAAAFQNFPASPRVVPRGSDISRCARGSKLCPLLMVGLPLALTPGCELLHAPRNVVTAVVPGGRSRPADPVELQLQVQRFADDYSAQTATAVEEYARRVGTDTAHAQALQWKLAAASAAVGIASGPQPTANLLDLVALATLNRAVIEDRRASSPEGPALQPWFATSRMLETNAWDLAARNLTPAQAGELREAIAQWQRANPLSPNLFAARPSEFAAMVKTVRSKGASPTSVFSLVGLDPTAGLDPAVQEVTRTRLLAERALYTLQRMPYLLRWQTELLVDQVARQPGVLLALSNSVRLADGMERIGHAAEAVSQTAAALPDQIARERQAVLAALDQQEGKLRELAGGVERALTAADGMAGTLTITITNFDALMKRFGVGEAGAAPVPDAPSAPFNILDYARTAAQIETMARELNALIVSVNQSVPQVERLSQQAGADVDRLMERGFRLGMALIGLFLVGAVLAGLAYRFLAGKLNRGNPAPRETGAGACAGS